MEGQNPLVDELSARQDEVLSQLASLNERLEALLTECLASRSALAERDQAAAVAER